MRQHKPSLPALLAVISSLSMWGTSARPPADATDGTLSVTVATDSVVSDDTQQTDIPMAIPEAEHGTTPLMTGLIPLPPQAASLARYAEYPVSHTTGIPDISIPIYEIDLGGFRLPLSLSYHASGARADEVPTCVGLGWALNAGGMISRTILGAPDFYKKDEASTDYTLRDYDRIHSIKGSDYGLIMALATGDPEYDTESDRYCLNAGGHSLVFRYSHEARKFVVLNHEPCRISSSGYGEGMSFTVEFPDGTDWTFSEVECSGVDRDGEGHPYVSAWYVTRISTRWGDIDFTYRHGQHLMLIRESEFYTAGTFISADDEGRPEEEDMICSTYIRSHLVLGQTLVESISWNGNRIMFDYSSPWPGEVTDRLETIRVISSDDSELKRVSLGNDFYWPSLNALLHPSDHGRRLLKSVMDSQLGTYTMEYDTHLAMPRLGQMCVDLYSDFYGYYRKGPSGRVNERMREWLWSAFEGKPWRPDITVYPDRTPDADALKTGMLKKIKFPTGGHVSFEYEANGPLAGGLHLSAMTVNDGNADRRYSYSYSGALQTQENPQDLLCFDTYMVVVGMSIPYSTYIHKKAVSSPVFSPFLSSSSVAFTKVCETLPDGSHITYEYEKDELAYRYGYEERIHPTLNYGSIIDWGNRLPLLKCLTITDASGKCMFEENIVYDRNDSRDEISTGVRVAMEYTCFDWGTKEYGCYGPAVTNGIAFGARKSRAKVRSATVRSRTTKDWSTGVWTAVDYTYDPSLRTTLPRTVTISDDAGTTVTTEYTYPFDRADAVCKEMTLLGVTDAVVAVRVSSDGQVISSSETDYILTSGFFQPAVTRSWSAPTASTMVAPPATLPERERVSAYNSKGRPVSVTVNGTDVTSFTWDSTGVLLQSSTAPGGLKTMYTHRPLFGLASVTLPNGYATNYSYNAAGMLQSVSDNSGVIEEYTYSIYGHPKMNADGTSIATHRKLNASGSQEVLTKQYYSGLGLPSTLVNGGMNTKGEYIFSTTGYDRMGRPEVSILPGAGGKTAKFRSYNEIYVLSQETHGEDYTRSQTTYDALDRPVKVTTPGDAWHEASKAKVTEYISNAANSVRLYRAPMDRISLVEDGYYAAKTLQGVRTVDEDGKEMTVYTDRLGRKVLERRGPESKKGQNDTYFVYNDLGQLRYVLSPGYEFSGYKDKFAYEYRYDEHGNVVKKSMPGAGYTQYWYDRAGRMSFMQDPNLRGQNLHRFFIYDRAGRLAMQGVSASCNRNEAVNFADYTGGTGGFMQTGYTLTDAFRLQQVTLETVSYYDSYTFATYLDQSLYKSGAQSAKGRQTGCVTYTSDGKKSISAFYYDIRGNVTECRERTPFGTLRTTVNTFTYTGQPLKSTVTEDGVTTITENTYDPWSGLLTATDVTVNGTKQRVSSVTYDDLGRISSVTRGAEQNSGGKVSYKYNIHGQTTEIKGPGLTQNLFYADGPGNKLYNGSVSAMTWTMGTDTRIRGYKYSYNDYNWLTEASYGESESLGSNKNRYSEKFTSFTRNGGVKELLRMGLRADGTYGSVDFLSVGYSGNQVYRVVDGAPVVTQNGSMDFPGGIKSNIFTYNDFGALTSDSSRGITGITYDNFGNPTKIQYTDNRSTSNVYSAAGEKLQTVHVTGLAARNDAVGIFEEGTFATQEEDINIVGANSQLTIEYHGNVIYRNDKVDMILFPGGYATINGTLVTFHYYTQDYLGNNRAVINGSTGAIEQTVAYYPCGGIIVDLSSVEIPGQPYKFGGKELITANGLNEYDFGARQYYTAVPGFTSIDPFCEDTQWLSPYLFCGNDPVNNTDPTGAILETVWDIGNVLYDVGEAAYNHMTGNHDKAKQNWIDAGLDIGAMLIPGIPAGASKVGKAVKAAVGKADNVADAVSDVKKASKGMKNADRIAEGKEFGAEQAKNFKNIDKSAASEVTLVPLNGKGNVKGNRNRVDILKGDKDGTFQIIEFKLTDKTPLSKGQKNAFEQVKTGDGMFEIRSKIKDQNLYPGNKIKVTDYIIKSKYK